MLTITPVTPAHAIFPSNLTNVMAWASCSLKPAKNKSVIANSRAFCGTAFTRAAMLPRQSKNIDQDSLFSSSPTRSQHAEIWRKKRVKDMKLLGFGFKINQKGSKWLEFELS